MMLVVLVVYRSRYDTYCTYCMTEITRKLRYSYRTTEIVAILYLSVAWNTKRWRYRTTEIDAILHLLWLPYRTTAIAAAFLYDVFADSNDNDAAVIRFVDKQ